MSYIARIAVAMDVGGPFVLCCVGVAGADVARLELLELLLGAEFVCLVGRLGVGIGGGVGVWVELTMVEDWWVGRLSMGRNV